MQPMRESTLKLNFFNTKLILRSIRWCDLSASIYGTHSVSFGKKKWNFASGPKDFFSNLDCTQNYLVKLTSVLTTEYCRKRYFMIIKKYIDHNDT